MSQHYGCFSFQVIVQELRLNLHLLPLELKVLLKCGQNCLESKPISITRKVSNLWEIFCFECELPFKKVSGLGIVHLQKKAQIKLIANKYKDSILVGTCTIMLSEFANKNSFYYQNQIRLSLEACQDPKAYLVLTIKLNRLNYELKHQSPRYSLTSAVPPSPSPLGLRSLIQSRKVLGVSRLIDIQDPSVGEQSQNSQNTFVDDQLLLDEKQPSQERDNLYLAQKLTSLYNKLQSLAQMTPHYLCVGTGPIKESPDELIESSMLSSMGRSNEHFQLEKAHQQLKRKYDKLVGEFKEEPSVTGGQKTKTNRGLEAKGHQKT